MLQTTSQSWMFRDVHGCSWFSKSGIDILIHQDFDPQKFRYVARGIMNLCSLVNNLKNKHPISEILQVFLVLTLAFGM